jgi:hypothetical protein
MICIVSTEKKATKKARQFNIETLIAENLQTAQERQREAIENRQIQIITDNNDNASCDDKKANEETREKIDSIRIRTSNSSDNESNNQRSTNKTAIASSRTRKSDHVSDALLSKYSIYLFRMMSSSLVLHTHRS